MLEKIYWLGTDFCIQAANGLGISYEAFNFWLFMVIMPGLAITLAIQNMLPKKNKPGITPGSPS